MCRYPRRRGGHHYPQSSVGEVFSRWSPETPTRTNFSICAKIFWRHNFSCYLSAMRVHRIDQDDPEEHYGFICPGCNRHHYIPTKGPRAWGFNGDLDSPTFTPSILSYYESGTVKSRICHSFVTDGRIQFLGDCQHEMAGQTVDLPEIE